MIWIYRFLYPVFIFLLWLFTPFFPKLRLGFRRRANLLHRTKAAASSWAPAVKRYWFHFASAGEFEQVLPILDRMREQSPEAILILTYFSPSAEKAIFLEAERRRGAQVDIPWSFSDYSPFDFFWSAQSFLNILNPTMFVTVHRELWPEIIFNCKERGIPCYLIGASFPSVIRWNRLVYSFCLSRLSHIFAVNAQTQKNLFDLDPNLPVTVLGDPRAERVFTRKTLFNGNPPWKSFFEKQQVLIGASLWDEDYRLFSAALKPILKTAPQCRLIIVPHEPSVNRLANWSQDLKSKGIECRLWSDWSKTPDSFSHVLVDQVGVLAELYSVASCVIVGGSFKRRVHNVLEPLIYGCGIITGPFIDNSAEALDLASRDILKVVHNSSELCNAATELITSNDRRKIIADMAQQYFKEKESISKTCVTALLRQ